MIFSPKPPEVFERGAEFATQALSEDGTKLFIHCAAGGAPGADDDAGGVVLDGLDAGCGPGPDRERTPGGGFCGNGTFASVERFLDQQVRAEK